MSSWATPADDFYLIHTALAIPAIAPEEWRLRIHGMVDRELVLRFQDLIDRRLTEAWITLNCVSNPVGGDLIGNAWWSGVRLADLLAEAGVRPDADAVLQTSEDGWTCGTPLAALTDDRDAMLAVAMNGRPLPVEHGFPVRTIVPGLYGFVSATKWVVDLEVTRFDRFEAYWTGKGWAEQAPVRLASRIDVPRSGAGVPAGEVRVGGVAWAQHVGIEGVEVSVDGGAWTERRDRLAADRRHLGAVGGHGRARARRPRAAGAGDEQGGRGADRRRARRRARTAPPAGTRSTSPPRTAEACPPRSPAGGAAARQRVVVVGDHVDQAAGRRQPDVLELATVVGAPHAAVGPRRRVVDDDVAVPAEADDHQQVAGGRRDRRAVELAGRRTTPRPRAGSRPR